MSDGCWASLSLLVGCGGSQRKAVSPNHRYRERIQLSDLLLGTQGDTSEADENILHGSHDCYLPTSAT